MSRGPAPDPALGVVLRRLREERGLTLETLAFMSRISMGSLGRIENSRSSAAWSTVRQIASALNVTMTELGKLVEAEQTA